jgi:uncharacterized membrane protein YccF (DUF307 family)
VSGLRTIANVIWLIVAGWELALAWWVAGVLVCLTIVGIPFGTQLFKIGAYAAWPFGRRAEVTDASALGTVGNVLWVVLVGWWLALAHIVAAVAVGLTIVGLPAAWVNLKLVPIAFTPFGRRIVETGGRA